MDDSDTLITSLGARGMRNVFFGPSRQEVKSCKKPSVTKIILKKSLLTAPVITTRNRKC